MDHSEAYLEVEMTQPARGILYINPYRDLFQ